jgi:hypothetical protein
VETTSICDYSLHNVASRPARVGDTLVIKSFDGTFTRGFAAITEPNVAVCLLPGTELAFENEVNGSGAGGHFGNPVESWLVFGKSIPSDATVTTMQ